MLRMAMAMALPCVQEKALSAEVVLLRAQCAQLSAQLSPKELTRARQRRSNDSKGTATTSAAVKRKAEKLARSLRRYLDASALVATLAVVLRIATLAY